jgi:membrane-associated phospholipid phosphatase
MNDEQAPAPSTTVAKAPTVTAGEVVTAAKHGRLRTFLKARLEPKTYLGLHLTVGLILCAAGTWLFAVLLDALLDNAMMVRVDMSTDAFIHARMTPSLLRIVLATTEFGGPIAMTALGVIGAIVLWRARQRVILWGWIAAFAGGVVIDEVLKRVVHRTRPIYSAGIANTDPFSFPSGHAMGSMIGYGMLVWTLFVFWHPSRAWRISIYALAGVLVLVIGLSRIFLGVHYPSDVAGGWAAALVWLSICITGVNVVRHRRL